MAVLEPSDLENLIGAAEVARFSNRDGGPDRNDTIVFEIIAAAEDYAYSLLAPGWPSRERVDALLLNDVFLRREVAWIACEYLSESKPEFLNADGSGRFMAQFKRSTTSLERAAKGAARSPGETRAGVSSNIGGTINPAKEPPRFVFAVSKDDPTGGGGF